MNKINFYNLKNEKSKRFKTRQKKGTKRRKT